jgi:protein ImuA
LAPSEPTSAEERHPVRQRRWELGCSAADALLPKSIETNAVHEVKGVPSVAGGASAADWMASIGFAARLAARRVDSFSATRSASRPWVLWCWPKTMAGEFGSPSSAGFAHLGLAPARLIIVETARSGDALNAIEESLKGASLAVVVGVLDDLDLMPARRLSLAAGEMATPCLIVTHPASAPAGATATRWRIKRLPSAAHRFDPRAPGASRFEVALERCRARPESAAQPPFVLEWSDETHRFDLASVVADLPAQTRRAGSGADAPAFRSR